MPGRLVESSGILNWGKKRMAAAVLTKRRRRRMASGAALATRGDWWGRGEVMIGGVGRGETGGGDENDGSGEVVGGGINSGGEGCRLSWG